MTLPNPPNDGRSLYRWACETEVREHVGLVKYLEAWAALQGYPRRWLDWTEAEVRSAYQAGVKRLAR